MAQIVVRIPKEIKDYQEKLILGLSVRQLLTVIGAAVVIVPVYYFGRDYINSEVMTWFVLLLGLPLFAFGWVRWNGMPFEQLMYVWLSFNVLLPRKRKYYSKNAYKEWVEQYDRIKAPKGFLAKRRAAKMRREASLEKAYLLAEAEKRGDTDFDVDKAELLTVKSRKGGWGNGGGKKKNTKKVKEVKKSKLQTTAEAIEHKQKENPEYLPTKKEFNILKKWKVKQRKIQLNIVKKGKKEISKENEKLKKRKTAKTTLPKTVQDTIPYIADYDEGMFEVQPNKYSKMYSVKDINYRLTVEDEQVNIFCKYREFLNYFTDDYNVSFIVDNRVISVEEQENRIFYKSTGDEHDVHRQEYNKIMRRQIQAGKNDISVEKFVVVTLNADSPIEALQKFKKTDAEVIQNLKSIGSDGKVLSTTERLAFCHDKYRKGSEGQFKVDFDFLKKNGISSKDYIAPASFEFNRSDFRIDDGWYRIMFLNNLPANLGDDFLCDLVDNNFPVTTSISFAPMAADKGLKLVKRQLTGMEANKIEAEKRAMRSGYSPETIRHDLKQSLHQAYELLDDIINKDQKLFEVTITLMVYGATKDELDANCKTLKQKANKVSCAIQPLVLQQEEGYKVTMPFGYPINKLSIGRTLTSESTAIFMPFSTQELFQPGGFYYGLNQLSRNLILCDRTSMQTPSGFILGMAGSGKSFAVKREIINVLLKDNITNIIIIDPENEYGDICRVFGGEVIKISSGSDIYINPMDMSEDYGLDEDDEPDCPIELKKEKALKKKSEFLMSIVERMITIGSSAEMSTITPQQKTIVDRCVGKVYKEYLDHDFDPAYIPTLSDLQEFLDEEGSRSEDGRMMAEALEYYSRGSMNIFAKKSNINVDNRLIVFNIRDLGDQLRQIALTIMFDFIWNRMVENKHKNVRTFCYCDEIHVMFESYSSAGFLRQLYKRGRKYGMCITGITQNVEDLLRSSMARGMIGNSNFIMMLNQSPEDLKQLAVLLKISDALTAYVTRSTAGSGLLFAEHVIVPFEDKFPRESYLYKLMSTKFGENISRSEIDEQIKQILEEAKEKADYPVDDTPKADLKNLLGESKEEKQIFLHNSKVLKDADEFSSESIERAVSAVSTAGKTDVKGIMKKDIKEVTSEEITDVLKSDVKDLVNISSVKETLNKDVKEIFKKAE